jgi:cobyrinic acid a,c-diamide synthase
LEVPVLGALHRNDAVTWRERHLGLVPVIEQPDAVAHSISMIGDLIATAIDLEAVLALARAAPQLRYEEPTRAKRAGQARVAVASGPAFDFVYRDNLEALADAGAELLPFDPRQDPALPQGASALYAGGGFPEVFVSQLAANERLQCDLRQRVAAGLTIWAECGGMLWLSRTLDGHEMTGVIPADGSMTSKLTLGYRSAEVMIDCPWGKKGDVLRGHEFHYSTVTPDGLALRLRSRHGEGEAGFAAPRLLASYLHLHLGADPSPAERFVAVASDAS